MNVKYQTRRPGLEKKKDRQGLDRSSYWNTGRTRKTGTFERDTTFEGIVTPAADYIDVDTEERWTGPRFNPDQYRVSSEHHLRRSILYDRFATQEGCGRG